MYHVYCPIKSYPFLVQCPPLLTVKCCSVCIRVCAFAHAFSVNLHANADKHRLCSGNQYKRGSSHTTYNVYYHQSDFTTSEPSRLKSHCYSNTDREA